MANGFCTSILFSLASNIFSNLTKAFSLKVFSSALIARRTDFTASLSASRSRLRCARFEMSWATTTKMPPTMAPNLVPRARGRQWNKRNSGRTYTACDRWGVCASLPIILARRYYSRTLSSRYNASRSHKNNSRQTFA